MGRRNMRNERLKLGALKNSQPDQNGFHQIVKFGHLIKI